MRLFLLMLPLLLPLSASAAISINEVAWMGSASSANHEWIELYNNSSEAVSLEGWILEDGMNLSIGLTGSITPGSYAVLERSSDESAPGTAFLIYTGALVNTGATLVLKNAQNTIVDQVAGGDGWANIGGDNVTKETAQYTSRGWITAGATPGAQNQTTGTPDPEPEPEPQPQNTAPETTSTPSSGTTSPKKNSSGNSETIRLVVADTVLKLTPDVQAVAYVNQPVTFTVKASGIGKTIIDSLSYTWNFGDSYKRTGATVTHAYTYPGTYVVTIHATFGRHSQIARHEITVLPTTLSITRNHTQDIQLHNDAPYDVDVSGFVIRGEHEITLPPYSIMPPKGTITLASTRLESRPGQSLVGVFDQAKALVASSYHTLPATLAYAAPRVISASASTVPASPAAVALSRPVSSPVVSLASTEPVAPVVPRQVATPQEMGMASEVRPETESLRDSSPAATPTNSRWPYAAVIILVIGTIAVMYQKPVSKH